MIKYGKLLLIVFILGLLVLPLFHMNTAEITEQENRTLAKLPEMRKKGKLNGNYGKEFESWLGDRFWGRNELINARFQALYKINGRIENEKAFIGDDGWMFEKSKTANRPSIKKQREKIEKDAKILKAFADKFKDKNISIYLVLIPEREVLYQKYWEKYYKPKPYLDYGDEITKLLKDIPIIIINSKLEMIEAMERGNVYYKDDGHLNSRGGGVIRSVLLKRFGLNNLEYLSFKTKRFHYNYYSVLGLDKDKANDKAHFYMDIKFPHIKKPKKVVRENRWMYFGSYTENAIKTQTLHILGNCYGAEIIFPILSPLFSSSYFYRMREEEELPIIKGYFLRNLNEGDIVIFIGNVSKINTFL